MIYSRPDFKKLSMLAIFCMEAEKQIAILNDNLLALEGQTEDSVQCLEALMRSVHSIKGAARIVGLDLAVDVAHVMEDCFVAAKKGKLTLESGCVDVLLQGVDWFNQLAHVPDEGHLAWLTEHQPQTAELIEAIAQLLTGPSVASPVSVSAGTPAAMEKEAAPTSPVAAEVTPSVSEPAAVAAPEAATAVAPSSAPGSAPVRESESVDNSEPPYEPELAYESEPARELRVETRSSSAPVAPSPAPNPAPTRSDSAAGAPSVASKERIESNEQHQSDRAVKVNTEHLNHLMALAGEAVVEANWLQPFADTLQHLKQRQQVLTSVLDQLQQEVSLPPTGKKKLEEAKKTALDCQALLSDRMGDLDQFSRRFSQLSDNLYREVIASHMRPFSDGIRGFQRMVRDLARAEGKRVKLEVIGHNTQIDRDILERLEAPLTHMLRNAIAHGLETPAQRQQLGKPEVGTIRLEATHRAGMLSILVSDDGSGLDLEKLRQSVIDKQLTPPELATQLSEAELMEFLFLPGFSTAQQVTTLAGRGVGLDIAKSMVQEVGGLLRAFQKPGSGLSFHFQLPLTLSVIRALLVDISGEPYAFTLTHIDQVKLIELKDIAVSENRPYIVIDGENISLVKAQQILELPDTQLEPSATLPVVILRDQGHSYGIVVDRFLGERELVVRHLDERFGKIQDVSAAALTEEGLPLLIIDVADLVRSIENLVSGGQLQLLGDRSTESGQQQRVLVVDDSLTVREMERQLLQNHGYQVDVAVNGMEGWNSVRTGEYDLVISDIDMPRMNGIELVQQIKAHPRLKQLPVIIVSYKDRQTDQLAGLNAGADYYLTKSSFQDNSLLTAVTDLIG